MSYKVNHGYAKQLAITRSLHKHGFSLTRNVITEKRAAPRLPVAKQPKAKYLTQAL